MKPKTLQRNINQKDRCLNAFALPLSYNRCSKLHLTKGVIYMISKINISFLFIIPLLVAFLGCDLIYPVKKQTSLNSVEGNIIFSVKEGYEKNDSEPKIMLSMFTEKIYSCANYRIIPDIEVQGNEIFVNILGIEVPDICLTALGPATSVSFLNISNGKYSLYFSCEGRTDKYILTVTDSSIQVFEDATDTSRFTKPGFKLYWRYPRNSFVYSCVTTYETSWICQDFLDTLLSQIRLREFQFPDSGVIPYPRSARYFIYEKEEDFDKAGEILKSYTKRVISRYSGVGIALINWKNKFYYSWLFEN